MLIWPVTHRPLVACLRHYKLRIHKAEVQIHLLSKHVCFLILRQTVDDLIWNVSVYIKELMKIKAPHSIAAM